MNQLPDFMATYLQEQVESNKNLFQILKDLYYTFSLDLDFDKEQWLRQDKHFQLLVEAYNQIANNSEKDLILVDYYEGYDEGHEELYHFEFDFRGKDDLKDEFKKYIQTRIKERKTTIKDQLLADYVLLRENLDQAYSTLEKTKVSCEKLTFFQRTLKQAHHEKLKELEYEVRHLDNLMNACQENLSKINDHSHKALRDDSVIKDSKDPWLTNKDYRHLKTERIPFDGRTRIVETWIRK